MSVSADGTLHHICWIVRDLEGTAETLAQSLGVSWTLHTVEPESCTLHGEEAQFAFRFAVAAVGDSLLELITPNGGRSVYDEHLETRGEGYHHSCIVYPTRDAIRRAKEDLLAQGRELLQSAELGYGEFHYFRLPEIDAVLELLHIEALPPVDRTIG
jgi:catechol 2,3-dioxygenase-like lactoylglutathione lyase family enzyme